MERRTARISKEPEVRRQEILDTAMDVFMEKGYEAATMRDIAAAMHVVPGLCYRYFESKQVLYDAVVRQYVRDITAPMILLLEEEDDTLDGFLDRCRDIFAGWTEGNGIICSFIRRRTTAFTSFCPPSCVRR